MSVLLARDLGLAGALGLHAGAPKTSGSAVLGVWSHRGSTGGSQAGDSGPGVPWGPAALWDLRGPWGPEGPQIPAPVPRAPGGSMDPWAGV